ncbi:MAG: peroxide stress protein YaaA [Gammaproteobacteria bacterium]|nr:peroxide stress protein YaaA [Gammaproteobacteria bacterium]
MIVLLSPAKTLDYSQEFDVQHTAPAFLSDSAKLIKELKVKEPKDIASLMGLSDKLATLTFDRYQSWSASKTMGNDSKPALFVFQGDVYQGLQANTFNKKDITFAQKHLRILSGLYGELRPLDVIKPYRLEMGTKLPTARGKNLYEFWGTKVQENILKELKANKSNLVVNLASKEYFTVVGSLPTDVDVVSPVFKDFKNGEYKLISFYAKKARGYMSHWIIKNKVSKPEDLKNFDAEGYKYSKKLSTESEPVFLRN